MRIFAAFTATASCDVEPRIAMTTFGTFCLAPYRPLGLSIEVLAKKKACPIVFSALRSCSIVSKAVKRYFTKTKIYYRFDSSSLVIYC